MNLHVNGRSVGVCLNQVVYLIFIAGLTLQHAAYLLQLAFVGSQFVATEDVPQSSVIHNL